MNVIYEHVKNFEQGIYAPLVTFLLKEGEEVPGAPHQMDTDDPMWANSIELTNVVFGYDIPLVATTLAIDVRPNLPWAEDHFQERVSGRPVNPPPSSEYWPFTVRGHEDHLEGGKFSHTYPERFWPKHAGFNMSNRLGIRYTIGDLDDLLEVFARNPLTRQAYLPVWFPEDLTAARLGKRVPCTLGYHFLMREGKLNCTYFIRSCDLVRFFRDDVYMACRLVQWVCGQVEAKLYEQLMEVEPDAMSSESIKPGTLTMHITSLHCFEGDVPLLEKKYGTNRARRAVS